MKLFRLSSLDTLLTLLLLDGSWWSVLFLGKYLPFLVYVAATLLDGRNLDPRSFVILGFAALVFLRFKTPCLLLIAVLKNRVNEHCQLLKIWHWSSIFLDAVILAAVIVFAVLVGPGLGFGYISALTDILTFFILRIIFWSFARPMVLDLWQTENTLFPVKGCRGLFSYLGSKTPSLVKILLAWEILWNGILLLDTLTSILKHYFGGRRMFFFPLVTPGSHFGMMNLFRLAVVPWFLLICVIQMIGVEKGWKALLKVLLVLYIIGLVAFTLEVGSDLYYSLTFSVAAMVSELVLGVSQVALKLVLVLSLLKYFRESQSEEVDNEVFMQPLLPTEILAGKETSKE